MAEASTQTEDKGKDRKNQAWKNDSTAKLNEVLTKDDANRTFLEQSYDIEGATDELVGERLKAYVQNGLVDTLPEGVKLDEVDWTQLAETNRKG